MSGFGAWAAGAGGTGVLLLCLFTLGLILGELDGGRRGERRAEEDREREEAMARRTHPVYRGRPPDFDAIREAGRRAWAIQQERAEEEEWEPVHVGQALAVANETGQECADGREDDARDHRGPGWPVNGASNDPITTGEIAAITTRMDRFLEELAGVPYSADELWSGQ